MYIQIDSIRFDSDVDIGKIDEVLTYIVEGLSDKLNDGQGVEDHNNVEKSIDIVTKVSNASFQFETVSEANNTSQVGYLPCV